MSPLREISVEITNKCSQKCIHCSSNAGESFNNELTLKEIIDLINQAKNLNAEILTLSGGDPVLRKDLNQIIKHARHNDLEIRLQTAGAYIINEEVKSIPEQILESFSKNMRLNDKIVYSILGLKAVHDLTTGINKSYEKVLESIKKTKERGIFTEAHTVITSMNYKNLNELKEILEDNDIDSWHLLRLVPQGRSENHPEIMLNKKMFKKFQDDLSSLMEEEQKMKIELGHNIDYRFWINRSIQAQHCRIGSDKILIRANGDATYCAALKYDNAGNIRNNSLDYLWNQHPFIKELRNFLEKDFNKLSGECGSCDMLNDCRGGCIAQRIYEHQDLYKGPDPLCIK